MAKGIMVKVRGESLFKLGNSKLDKSILIFNMSSASECPAKRLGFCEVTSICYAMKPERQYQSVKKYRDRQTRYWKEHTAREIYKDIKGILKNRKYIKYFRFNEAGDFESQRDVKKLDSIATVLRARYGIKTYGYTARRDLDFNNVMFNIRLSGAKHKTHCNLPQAIAIKKDAKLLKSYYRCPGASCGNKCKVCMESKRNIALTIH